MKLHVIGLLYGDYPEIQKRFIESLEKWWPQGDETSLALFWSMVPAPRTTIKPSLAKLTGTLRPGKLYVVPRSDNPGKYIIMRDAFRDPLAKAADWILWLDDDCWIWTEDFWKNSFHFLEQTEAGVVGQHYNWKPTLEQLQWILKRPWSPYKTPQAWDSETKYSCPHGAAFWIRPSVIKKLDWPDPELKHNWKDNPVGLEGDNLLAVALAVNGIKSEEYHYGIVINDAPRRGIGAGCCP